MCMCVEFLDEILLRGGGGGGGWGGGGGGGGGGGAECKTIKNSIFRKKG